MSADLQQVGAAFRAVRVQNDITQEDLALKTGVSICSIQRLERGHSIGLDAYLALLRGVGAEVSVVPRLAGGGASKRATGRKSERMRAMREIRALWIRHRDRCAWSVRRDFEPRTRAEALFCLSCLEKQGDRALWIRSKELGKCL